MKTVQFRGKIVQNFIDGFRRKTSKNRELVKILRQDMEKLCPTDHILLARGCGKTYQRNYRLLCYFVYNAYCNWYEHCDKEIPVDVARRQINDCIAQCWDTIYS